MARANAAKARLAVVTKTTPILPRVFKGMADLETGSFGRDEGSPAVTAKKGTTGPSHLSYRCGKIGVNGLGLRFLGGRASIVVGGTSPLTEATSLVVTREATAKPKGAADNNRQSTRVTEHPTVNSTGGPADFKLALPTAFFRKFCAGSIAVQTDSHEDTFDLGFFPTRSDLRIALALGPLPILQSFRPSVIPGIRSEPRRTVFLAKIVCLIP
jgi:hypothetical protein